MVEIDQEEANCPECGKETRNYGRYETCPDHGVVLKAVSKVVGYREL